MLSELSPRLTPPLALVLGALLLGAACTPPPSPSDPPPSGMEASSDLPFTVIAEGQNAPTGADEAVYRDAEAWAAAGIEASPTPDFAREAVLLAAIDARSGGYRIRFDSVAVEGGEVVAHYTVEEPGPGCMTTQALTTPFQAVSVRDLPPGEVRFSQRREPYAC